MKITIYDDSNKLSIEKKEAVADFIFIHMGKYGDPIAAIRKAIDYAVKDRVSPGGHVFCMEEQGGIIGAVVINKTGMDEYIPENILVYIATHEQYRGQGLGQELMEYVIKNSEGDIALHCDKENPALKLYERLGFANPYLEMRLKKNK
ncbi:MAG: GNAT family N-acetyltransferase [Flavobacteriaceae bacterium]|nr:GNAT family N-acetyltransferase [Flavobacteriaceae bacterium]